ncbi:hypothetical protein MFUM_1010026 [Methylacidiphilum fumariolicum SolV]|uniref:Uncharacterized protein n=2 Tax=Candidatus Methylacidiphilum fumarolicum TaxID=591154 RepID=I0JVD7_METFB|nr:hypothetical protein [Candidatus Methylacidiphilum fumarolicum]CAI9084533.1 conserved protein of unknown function [Candidatus Methylacidiphilum fumarolicum]CCG91206.1 hypothetical protein MFUM_1010026 [Methylacidiphilum fumariolicum SolV]
MKLELGKRPQSPALPDKHYGIHPGLASIALNRLITAVVAG